MHGLLGIAGLLGLFAFAFGESAARAVVQLGFAAAGLVLVAFVVWTVTL